LALIREHCGEEAGSTMAAVQRAVNTTMQQLPDRARAIYKAVEF
jgi:hypothetical protein